MSDIHLADWYQLDFQIQNHVDDLLKIDQVMENLRQEGLISKWFFLWEGKTIRIRMKSNDRTSLNKRLSELAQESNLIIDSEYPFSDYKEREDHFFSGEIVEAFANIMSEVTQIAVKKAKGQIQFDNYRAMERICHCIFNALAGLSGKPEVHFLMQRTLERGGLDRDFENRIK